MRYSFEPVDVHRGDTELAVIAERIGVSPGAVQRWRERGMDERNADRVATALGLHPWQLWPEMLAVNTTEVTRECAHPDCYEVFILTRSDRRYCSARCRSTNPERMAKHRERARVYAAERYATDPEYRARQQAKRRADSPAARRARNAAQRAYYAQTAEKQRADRRARYRAGKGEAA